MTEILYDNSLGQLGAPMGPSDTSITFTGSPGWATLTGDDYIKLVLDPPISTNPVPNANFEIVYVTAYTGGASTGTITRGEEDTTPVAHAINATWLNSPTAADYSVGGGVTLGSSGTLFAADASVTVSADGASHQWPFQLASPPAWFTPSSGPTDYSQEITEQGLYVFGVTINPGVAPTTPGLYAQAFGYVNQFTVPLDTGIGVVTDTNAFGTGDVPIATVGSITMPTDITATLTIRAFMQRLAW